MEKDKRRNVIKKVMSDIIENNFIHDFFSFSTKQIFFKIISLFFLKTKFLLISYKGFLSSFNKKINFEFSKFFLKSKKKSILSSSIFVE